MSRRPLELVFKASCPYCTMVAETVETFDIFGKVETTAIESQRGRELIRDHHGEYVSSPHLFTDDLVYYGVRHTAMGMAKEYPRSLFGL